jgi:hypothetical protein
MPPFRIAPWRAELWQNGMKVADVSGSTEAAVDREIKHYAMIYAQDGAVEIKFKPPQRSRGGLAK